MAKKSTVPVKQGAAKANYYVADTFNVSVVSVIDPKEAQVVLIINGIPVPMVKDNVLELVSILKDIVGSKGWGDPPPVERLLNAALAAAPVAGYPWDND